MAGFSHFCEKLKSMSMMFLYFSYFTYFALFSFALFYTSQHVVNGWSN